MQILKQHIRDLIDKGIVTPLPPAVSHTIEQILVENFPLKEAGGLIDWDRFANSISCEWMALDDTEAVRWAHLTTAGKHSKAVLFYNSDEPCLLGNFDDVIRNLDSLIWSAPGPRIVIGVDLVTDVPQLSKDVIEFNGIDKLLGRPA